MFRYLNHDNGWPRVRRFGLEVEPRSGALALRRLPGPPRPLGRVPGTGAEGGPPAAGVAAGPDGVVYFSDPGAGRVHRLDPLTLQAVPVACGSDLARPVGLLVQRCRNRLLVADRMNHRIHVIDPPTGQVVGVWGQPWPDSTPRPAAALGGLDGPEHLAEDVAGGVYVLDRRPGRAGKRASGTRVVKFDADGRMLCRFWERVHAARTEWACRTGRVFVPQDVTVSRWKEPGTTIDRERVLILGTVAAQTTFRGETLRGVELWVWVFDPDGRPQSSGPVRLLAAAPPTADRAALPGVRSPLLATGPTDTQVGRLRGFSAIAGMVFVGLAGDRTGGCGPDDREPDRVWCFELADVPGPEVEPSWLPHYDGPVAALAVRGRGKRAELIVHAGPGREAVVLARRGARRAQGLFLAGPFTGNRDRVTAWHRVRFAGDRPPAARAQFFTLSLDRTRGTEWAPPPRPRGDRLPHWLRVEEYAAAFDRLGFAPDTEPEPAATEVVEVAGWRRPTAEPPPEAGRAEPGRWYAAPDGQLDFLARNGAGTPAAPADRFWLLGVLGGDGRASPSLTQGRVEYDADGWLADLPACYQRDPRGRAVVRSLLALFESVFEDATGATDRLPAMFDPHGTAAAGAFGPDGAAGWLAGCLALALPTGAGARERLVHLFADGPAWLARRGTPDGLRRLVWAQTGVEVVVEEPGVETGTWAGGAAGGSLAPAAPDGAVLGHDTVGGAALADPDDPRPALPADLAHHFVVRGYAADLSDPDRSAAVARAVADAAPAHATYSVQVIEPRLRVGVQARLGIDAVVGPARPVDPLALGVPPGPDARLAPASHTPPAVGTALLGPETRLT